MNRPGGALLVALTLLAAIAPAAEAFPTGAAIYRLSLPPAPGDHTLVVRVENFVLVPPNATRGDVEGEGQVHYLLNGFHCAGECSRGQAAVTNATRFTFHRLVAGDVIAAELRTNTGKPVLRNETQGNETKQVPVRVEIEVKPEAARQAPLLAIASNVPNAGDYTMRVRLGNFTLVPPGAPGFAEAFGTGYILYTKNGVPCGEGCSDAEPNSASTTFTFRGVAVGDRLGAELVRADGSPLAPRVTAVVIVARPAITPTSGPPLAGDYTLRVDVTGFTLAPPGGTPNAGLGHIRYMVKPKDAASFQAADGCGGSARTQLTEFRFCGLKEGDQVRAELVDTLGNPLAPPAQSPPLTVHRRPEEGIVTVPGMAAPLALLVLALAAVRRR